MEAIPTPASPGLGLPCLLTGKATYQVGASTRLGCQEFQVGASIGLACQDLWDGVARILRFARTPALSRRDGSELSQGVVASRGRTSVPPIDRGRPKRPMVPFGS